MNLRVRLNAITGKPDLKPHRSESHDSSNAIVDSKQLFGEGKEIDVTVFDRDKLRCGAELMGPSLIGKSTSMTFLPEGIVARVDGYGNLLLSM